MKTFIIKTITLAILLSFPVCAFPLRNVSPGTGPADQLRLGMQAWFEGHSDVAEKTLKEFLAKNPDNIPACHVLSLLLSECNKDFPQVTELYNRHRTLLQKDTDAYKPLLPAIEDAAGKGSPRAQLILARLGSWGLCRMPNPAQPMLWLRRASDGGYAQAQRELGLLYETGDGIEKNAFQAQRLYVQAAAQGDVFAMKFLGTLQLNSPELKADTDSALSYIRRAAEKDLPEAQLVMAQICHKGLHGTANMPQAVSWYRKAAQGGNTEAMNVLAHLSETGNPSPAEQAEAVHWYTESAKRGDALAQFRLGVLYYTGKSVKADQKKSFEYFKASALQGNATAWYNVGWMYRTGTGTRRDFKEARLWLERAAKTGSDSAQVQLGVMHTNGEGTPQDYAEAWYWFELARLCGSRDAQHGLDYLSSRLSKEAQKKASVRAAEDYKKMKKLLQRFK